MSGRAYRKLLKEREAEKARQQISLQAAKNEAQSIESNEENFVANTLSHNENSESFDDDFAPHDSLPTVQRSFDILFPGDECDDSSDENRARTNELNGDCEKKENEVYSDKDDRPLAKNKAKTNRRHRKKRNKELEAANDQAIESQINLTIQTLRIEDEIESTKNKKSLDNKHDKSQNAAGSSKHGVSDDSKFGMMQETLDVPLDRKLIAFFSSFLYTKKEMNQILILMTATTANMDPSDELSRRFGEGAVDDARRARTRLQGNRHRLMYPLVQPKPEWPNSVNSGLSMTSFSTDDAVIYCFQRSMQYQLLCDNFFSAGLDEDSQMFHALDGAARYNLDLLLSSSRIIERAGERERSTDHLMRALHVMQTAAKASFSWTSPQADFGRKARFLPYFYQENRAAFLVIWRRIQLLIGEVCWVTALEWAKILFALDCSDPIGCLLIFGFLAIRAGSASWFVRFAKLLPKPYFVHLPQVAFDYALALHIAQPEGEDADEALLEAARLHPRIINQILAPRRNNPEDGPGLTHLSLVERLFAHRLPSSIWFEEHIAVWSARVLAGVPKNEPAARLPSSMTDWPPHIRDSVFRHAILAEKSGLIAAMPEVVRQHALLDNPWPPERDVNPVGFQLNTESNPVVAFFRSIFPNVNDVLDELAIVEAQNQIFEQQQQQ